MSTKRKPNSRNPTMPSHRGSLVVAGLSERNRRHGQQLADLKKYDSMIEAFDEVLQHFRVLASTPGLDAELKHLLEEADRWLISGLDSILSSRDPHAVEEARLLLELEFLMRDFAANPGHLEEWATVDERSRQGMFGFGKLRQREEKRLGLDEDKVIAARNYWSHHSADSHPKPVKDIIPPTSHESFSFLSALIDLLQHAWSAVVAAAKCVSNFGVPIPPEYDQLSTSAFEEVDRKGYHVLNSHVPLAEYVALSQPSLKKQTPLRAKPPEQQA